MLLLFDIDGTLLNGNGIGRRCVEAALTEVVGRPVSAEGVPFSGKTDPQCLRDVYEANGIEATDTLIADGLAHYAAAMHATATADMVTVLPGVPSLVASLSVDDRVQLALLTGNMEAMAYLKVGFLGYDRATFPFGAFGSDSEARNDLPAIAADRARSHTGRSYASEEVVVIGDTPRDIACARHFGARAIAVATGRFDAESLAEHEPDALLSDLRDPAAFWAALGM
ncbi:MAG: HAD hydrolase-like protein [Bacteroidota bacterium]